MQINFKLSIGEASELARQSLEKRFDDSIGKVEIEMPIQVQSMSNRQVSGQNKIWLIKFLRSVANDIHRGDLKIDICPPCQNVSLADSKAWVEKYIEQNCHY